jgi:hypothetical protein
MSNDKASPAPIQSAEVAELCKPKVRFMWSSLFTNTATGIQFSLGAATRADFDVMAAELLESPIIDGNKVYEVAVLKSADYDALAATPAQPIAPAADVSAPTDERAAFEAWAHGFGFDDRALARSSATVGAYAWREAQLVWQTWQAARAAAPVSGPSDTQLYRTGYGEGARRAAQLMEDRYFPVLAEMIRNLQSAAPVSGQAPANPHYDYLARHWQSGFDGEPQPSGNVSELVAYGEGVKARNEHIKAKPVSGQGASDDELHFNAQRLRNVAKLVGIEAGGDDKMVDECRGAILGNIAAALRRSTEQPVSEMVNRFLGWPLPKTFAPDCGISFKPLGHPNGWPIGTNLLTADEAKAMFEHCLPPTSGVAELPPLPNHPVPGCTWLAIERKAITAYGQLCIDSRPRSEDSRAKVSDLQRRGLLALAERIDQAGGGPLYIDYTAAAAIRALASTTPPKVDNAN